jgi:hypothetical protein
LRPTGVPGGAIRYWGGGNRALGPRYGAHTNEGKITFLAVVGVTGT